MKNFKHVLLALDLHPHCDKATVEQGIEIAKDCGAKLTLIHAIEHINAYGMAQAYPTLIDIEEHMVDEAKEQLQRIQKEYDIPDSDILLEKGSPKMVIIDAAKECDADLIVLGSHGRHGISALLGSTANAVLHHAPCDVLAVRIK